jgi:RND family efflux transporter MFP subunit
MNKLILLLISIIVLSSCKKEAAKMPSDIDDLKASRLKLEKAKDSISTLIIKINDLIAEKDTTKKLLPVSVFIVKSSNYEHYISIQGNTKTDRNITVRPVASGLITGVFVKEGQRVSSNQLLFQIDDAILRNSINEISNQLTLANTTFERQKRLWDQKIGSEMQFLQAKNNKESLENRIKTLKAQLRNYKVRAPFNGIIDDLIANKGDLASPQTAMLQIVNLRHMYVESDVAENFLKSVKKGSKAIVNFASIGEEVTAKISQIGNNINPENRSFKVRIDLQNKKGHIKPNLLADIKIMDFNAKNAIVIPKNLIQIDENGHNFVFTITKDSLKNIVTKKLVDVSSNYNNKSLITSGLSDSDILIDEGSRTVSNHQEVHIKSENNTPKIN